MLNRLFQHIFLTSLFLATVAGCSSPMTKGGDKITVSIPPLKYLVEKIVGDDFEVVTLLPPGTSPETFELTPQQMKNVDGSLLIFTIGLIDFEIELSDKLNDLGMDILPLGINLDLIEATCAHGHKHGEDPHVWTSPVMLKHMAKEMYAAVNVMFPDSVKYRENFDALMDSIETTDLRIRSMVDSADIKDFVIYHPALTYFARDYGLLQIQIEREGKEPSAADIANIVKYINEHNIDKILYQSQFSGHVVAAVVREAGAEPIEFDPLSEDVLSNLEKITATITQL